MKTKLFFHIGQAKTGSSAIQAFLNCNRNTLAKKFHVLYPNFSEKDFSKGTQHNHEQIFTNSHRNNDYAMCIQTFINCKEYCERNEITKLVISLEGFDWNWWPSLLKQIVDELELEYEFILYLKRQDLWIESAWKQWGHKDSKYTSIIDFSLKQDMYWNKVLNQWLNFFEPDVFIIRPFEKNVIGDDVVNDFLEIIGITNRKDLLEPPDNNLTVNAGLSPVVIEILRKCNYMLDSPHDNNLLDFMYARLPDKFKKKDPFSSYGFLTFEQRKQIVEMYAQSNLEISNRFFGEERKALFFDPIDQDNDSKVFSGLTLDNTIPVIMELFIQLSNEIYLLKQNNNSNHSKKMQLNSDYIFCNIFTTKVICEKIDLINSKIKAYFLKRHL